MGPTQITVKPILVVEDDQHHAELIVEALQAGGLTNRVVTVETGEAALNYFFHEGRLERPRWGDLRDCPCLVILDLKLPDMSGLEVLKRLKQDRIFELIPVMILTTSANERDIKRAYDLQTNAYLTKPVDFTQFFEKVRQAGVFWAMLNEQSPD